MRFRILASLSALLLCCQAMNAQTNVQLHYDFGRNIYSGKKGGLDLSKEGSNRQAMTMTVEHFNVDRFGSNFFFVDLDFVPGSKAFRGAYFEISRELCFWKGTPVEGLSAHIEYNGGLDRYSGSYDDAYLLGPTYSFHSKDWSFTGSVTAMYKVIPGNAKNMHNFQLTGVWNWTFCKGMLSFNGFADFWMENRPWQLGAKGRHRFHIHKRAAALVQLQLPEGDGEVQPERGHRAGDKLELPLRRRTLLPDHSPEVRILIE